MTDPNKSFQWIDFLGLRVVYRYKLFNAIPLDGTASYAEIAADSGLKESLCRRFIRTAIASNIFNEDTQTGRVRHTAASRLMATDSDLCDALGLDLEDIGPSSVKIIDAWEKYGQESGEPTDSAFCMYNETDKPVFAFLSGHPERARRFGTAMRFFTKDEGWDIRHLGASFDWSLIDKPGNVIVDIGGGHGQISQFLARQTSSVGFVVQDLPHVAAEAPSHLPPDLKGRFQFQAHDFLTPQTIHQPLATVFFLRWILHNWPDKYCVLILKGLVPAMRAATKVLIYEFVLPDGPAKDPRDRYGFQMDIIMATFHNARERSRMEFEGLLKAADRRFFINSVNRPEGSALSLIDVGWSEQ